jgi:hypothetical protein
VTHLAVVETLLFLLCPHIILDSNFLGRVVSHIVAQREVSGRVRFSDKESVLSFHQTTRVSRFFKVQGNKSPYDGDWVYWSTRLGRDPSKPRRVTRLLKRQRGCCAHCGLRFTTEDVIEVHHHDRNHNNNAFDNLRLMHGHCHDIVHGSRCL